MAQLLLWGKTVVENGITIIEQGTIICAFDDSHKFGRIELLTGLVVPCENLTLQEARNLTVSLEEIVETVNIEVPEYFSPEQAEKLRQHHSNKNVIHNRYIMPTFIIKDGFFPSFDEELLTDETKAYQPLLDYNIKIDFVPKIALIKDRKTGKFPYKNFKKL